MSIATTMIIRLEIRKSVASFGDVASGIAAAGGDIVAIDVIRAGKDVTTRDITVNVQDAANGDIISILSKMPGIKIINVSDRTFLAHLGGKIEITPKMPIKNREDLSLVYTPGVARVCTAIAEDPRKAYSLTMKRNTVAVVSDGTAVLGLGDIGPEAAMPVMEGKAMLFKQLANIDAFPLCLNTKDPDEIINIVKAVSPGFGGINLEDISSPRCFEIERRLAEELDIPVFHDDQHGTSVVAFAGLLNALKVVNKSIENARIVVVGIGAAGVSICNLLLAAGARYIYAVDREGVLRKDLQYDNPEWQKLAAATNPEGIEGGITEVIRGADVFIGVSRGGILTVDHLKSMASDNIVFAMANPTPEIEPDLAEPFVRVLATGRSDYPNQINNVLCFPGIFRGALDCRARTVNLEMKLAAAKAIASVVHPDELNEQYIIPSIFNEKVVEQVRLAVIQAAISTDAARRIPKDVAAITE
ncbi:NAD-dependent malic enzyme [Paenibacillus odorifer]|jgi:malate dehydrogenase (oxaloacetate-decarboxylating)|uniref:NAD-dependent malic enzyme n=1 Tax=Paenibacillus odorifer TaxID=189426 RepID=A0A1R0YR89_9BACL|nr:MULTISPECIES: NAD-dependent malic enzyme [Paenibacillus]AWV33140.1 NAD-dependent malic enzyme [Paenibacillus odorifer]MDH6426667.1 malate dehydrogenase (oxaloacetate-decarboxylating) [Paenibacillus sp. PastH-4]MDH6442691.1 malate dehydrogenase (oxaloacetate-decarboxylating) [Paenibacillus sp. PastF-4]MDH6526597.1 malate dehydrogenase (oxaloacetate-decarboxylating) [Paenibacillus sp. PastH-3]OMC75152.1 NAD-dependent malic enzyme [Paenibacillus odorifer]